MTPNQWPHCEYLAPVRCNRLDRKYEFIIFCSILVDFTSIYLCLYFYGNSILFSWIDLKMRIKTNREKKPSLIRVGINFGTVLSLVNFVKKLLFFSKSINQKLKKCLINQKRSQIVQFNFTNSYNSAKYSLFDMLPIQFPQSQFCRNYVSTRKTSRGKKKKKIVCRLCSTRVAYASGNT